MATQAPLKSEVENKVAAQAAAQQEQVSIAAVLQQQLQQTQARLHNLAVQFDAAHDLIRYQREELKQKTHALEASQKAVREHIKRNADQQSRIVELEKTVENWRNGTFKRGQEL